MNDVLSPAGISEPTTAEGTVVADHMIDTLVAWGVRRVFSCPGSTEAAFLHAAAKRDDMDVLLTTHESIAVSMADGYGRVTGEPAVAYLHANVGLTNGLSHLYAAQLAKSPVVVLTGLKQTQIQGRDGFTTAPYIRDFVRQYSKWTWQSLRADAVVKDVARALQISSTTPQGPTWIGLSQDLVEDAAQSSGVTPPRLAVDGRVRASETAVRATAELLQLAQRPIIVAGADIAIASVRGQGTKYLIELAERLGLPVFVEDRRGFERTVFPTSHEQFAGLYDVGRASVASADLVLFIGARCFLEFEAPTRSDIPAHAKVVHTHPDPAEVGKIHGADVAAVADSTSFLEDLLAHIDPVGGSTPTLNCLQAREEQIATKDGAVSFTFDDARLPTVAQVMGALADNLDANSIVVGDATTSGKALIHAVEGTEATLHTTSSGSLGWGTGAAMGIKLAKPDSRVIAVCGDGAFQFGLQGLWTAARYQIAVTYVVVNNEAYAAVGAAISRYTGGLSVKEREIAVDLGGPSLADVARGFGVQATRVEGISGLIAELQASRDATGPVVLEIMTDPLDLGP